MPQPWRSRLWPDDKGGPALVWHGYRAKFKRLKFYHDNRHPRFNRLALTRREPQMERRQCRATQMLEIGKHALTMHPIS